MRIDEDAVKDLNASLRAAGLIYSPIACKQHPDRILSGVHRIRAGAKKPPFLMDIDQRAKELGLGHDLTELVIRVVSNVQRHVSPAERAEEFTQMAKLLKEEGVEKGGFAGKIHKITGFSESYVLSLLPPEYKEKEKATSQGRPRKSVIPIITESYKKEGPEKKEYGSKGQSPSSKQNLVSEFTPSQMSLIGGLEYLHVPFKTEWRVPVQKWSCRKCTRTFTDEDVPSAGKDGKRLCPKDQGPLEQVQYRCDVFVQTNAGFAVSLEAEGEGSASSDNPERDQLLARANVRVAHISNKHADDWAEEIAGIVRACLL